MRGEQAMTSTISPVGQVRDDAVPVVAAVEAAPVHLRPIGPDAGCAVLTLAVLAVAVTDPGHPAWAGTALAVVAAAAATLRCAGGAVEGRLTAADGEARGDGPVERARRGAAVLQRAADRAVGGFAAVVVVL